MRHGPLSATTLSALLAASLLVATGCGSEGTTIVDGDTDRTDTLDTTGDVDTTETGSDGDVSTEESEIDLPDGETDGPPPDVYGACTTNDDCRTSEVCEQGVCIVPPSHEAELYQEHQEWDESKDEWKKRYDPILDGNGALAAPDLSCAGAQFTEDLSSTGKTNILGYINVFGLEASCSTVYVDVFTHRNPDGSLGDYDCTASPNAPAAEAKCTGNPAWVGGRVVEAVDAQVDGHPEERCYVFVRNVPTDRWLVFRASNFTGTVFKNTYAYNLFVKHEDAVTADRDGYRVEVNAISRSSYQLIPTTAGVSGGVQEDRGAIAGTVRDCQGRRVKYGTVGVTGVRTSFNYFNGNANNLLPQVTLKATNDDGTWGSIDHEEGTWTAVSMLKSGGSTHSSKAFAARMYRDSVAIIAFRIGNPINYPAADPAKFVPDAEFPAGLFQP